MPQSFSQCLIPGTLFLAACAAPATEAPKGNAVPSFLPPPSVMTVESPAFGHGKSIPPKYTCDGADVNPTLEVRGVPDAARSLVLITDDPDAPVGTWTHWTVWNINPETSEIGEHSVPDGAVEGETSFGTPGYGGPCPPSGVHRYFFKLYALDTVLDLLPGSTVEELQEAVQGHVIDEAVLMGRYGRG